ncbi:MAG: energy transducer TonB [Bacteroidia bacterium]
MNKIVKTLFLLYLLISIDGKSQLGANKPIHHFGVDWFPEIYGGKDEIKRFLHDHLIYPAQDFKDKKEGIVVLYFVVTQDGKAVNVQVAKSATPAMDKEAIRLLSLLNDWIPASKDEKTINANNSFEVNFSISKYKKAVKERGFDTPLYTDLPTDTSLHIYENAQQPPAFNSADKTFPEFVYSNLQYPETAVRQNIEGNVKLTFIVETDGQVSNIKILNGVNGGCTFEAIRVIGLTKWKPAVRDNQYVRYKMPFTMGFSLKNNFKDNASGSQRSWGQ